MCITGLLDSTDEIFAPYNHLCNCDTGAVGPFSLIPTGGSSTAASTCVGGLARVANDVRQRGFHDGVRCGPRILA